jgi:hypothetical protein
MRVRPHRPFASAAFEPERNCVGNGSQDLSSTDEGRTQHRLSLEPELRLHSGRPLNPYSFPDEKGFRACGGASLAGRCSRSPRSLPATSRAALATGVGDGGGDFNAEVVCGEPDTDFGAVSAGTQGRQRHDQVQPLGDLRRLHRALQRGTASRSQRNPVTGRSYSPHAGVQRGLLRRSGRRADGTQ